jgi:hypothetical protein
MKTSSDQRFIGCGLADFCPDLAQTEAIALAVMGGSSLVAPIGCVAEMPAPQAQQAVQR